MQDPANQTTNQESADSGNTIPPINLPSGLTVEKVLSYAKSRNKSWETFFAPKRGIIQDYHRLYRTQNTNKIKSQENLIIPLANSIVETTQARIVPAIFNKPKLVEAIPKFMSPDDGSIQTVEDFINQEMLFICRTPEKGADFIKGTLIEGTGIGKAFWKIETEERSNPQFALDPNTGQQIQIGQSPASIQTQGADWEPKSLLNMAWEPNLSTRIQDSQWVRESSYLSQNDLLRMQQEGRIQNVDKIEAIVPAGVKNKDDWETQRKQMLGESGIGNTNPFSDDKVYRIDEWYACISWKDPAEEPNPDGTRPSHYEEFHFFVVEEQVLMMFEVNPLQPKRKPYFSYRYRLNPRELLGGSLLEPIKMLNEQVNTFVSKETDLITKAADVPIFYDSSSGVNGRSAILRTNGLIAVENVNGIKEMPIDVQAIQETRNFIQDLIELSRDATAANEQMQGISDAKNSTATESSIVAQSGSVRFNHAVEMAQLEFIRSLAKEFFWLYRQFGQDGQMFVREDTTDGKAVAITRQMINIDLDWVPSDSMIQQNKGQKLQAMNQIIQGLAQLQPQLQAQGVGVDFKALFVNVVFPYADIKNGQQYLPQLPPPRPMPGLMPGQPPPQGMPPMSQGPMPIPPNRASGPHPPLAEANGARLG